MFCVILAIPTFGTSQVLPARMRHKPANAETFPAIRLGTSRTTLAITGGPEAEARCWPSAGRSLRLADLACCPYPGSSARSPAGRRLRVLARCRWKSQDRLETEPVRLLWMTWTIPARLTTPAISMAGTSWRAGAVISRDVVVVQDQPIVRTDRKAAPPTRSVPDGHAWVTETSRSCRLRRIRQ
jgi:hypothetical protein